MISPAYAWNPMTREEVDAKAYDLMAAVLGKRRARAICDTVWSLEAMKDLRGLGEMLRA